MSTANVRSLLRNERKARRVDHPHAAYNAAGILSCQLCHIQIKAESLWNQHLRGSHHRGQQQRHRAAQASKAVAVANSRSDPTEQVAAAAELPNGDDTSAPIEPPKPVIAPAPVAAADPEPGNKRKRKADDDGQDDKNETAEPAEDTRPKKPRARLRSQVPLRSPTRSRNDSPVATVHAPAAPAAEPGDIDEAEWEAFTREVASPPPVQVKAVPAVIAASATISAAPMTAAQIAAHSREDESRQARERREAEMEDELEDAADRIAEEIEEQELLLERVNKWKERREALRQQAAPELEMDTSTAGEDTGDIDLAKKTVDEESEGSDEDDEDDFDGWGLLRN